MSLSALLTDLRRPAGALQSPSDRAGTAAGHVLVGACIATVLALTPVHWGAWWLVAFAAYFAAKEVGDLRRGGGLWDGVIDAAFVALGAVYIGPWWWPWVALAAAGADGAYGKRWRD